MLNTAITTGRKKGRIGAIAFKNEWLAIVYIPAGYIVLGVLHPAEI
jgi:hypothetical protein